MMKELSLVKILKDCKKGTKLYSLVHGDVELNRVVPNEEYPIWVFKDNGGKGGVASFLIADDGRLNTNYYGECILFPSKYQKDWSKFKVPVEKFNPRTLHPFNKVIVRLEDQTFWSIDFFSFVETKNVKCVGGYFNRCVPYNDDTKHLLGTSDEAPEYYRYWED